MILSIVIPVFNVEPFLVRCLESCVSQSVTGGDLEIIIINDGSQDGSLAIAEDYSKRYSFIKVFSQDNQGLSAARNKGLKHSQGDYIWFVDSDDWIAPNCLLGLFQKIQETEPDIVGICKANVINGKVIEHFFFDASAERIVLTGEETIKQGLLKNICSPYSIFRRQFLLDNNLSFYEGIFHEDSEFTPRAYYLSKRVSFYNRICYFTFLRQNSITTTINPKRSFDLITVAESLHRFTHIVSDNCLTVFHNYISNLLNESLLLSKAFSADVKYKLSNLFYDKRNLFSHLLKSNKLKYKLEGFLFCLFPRRVLRIYNILVSFKRH